MTFERTTSKCSECPLASRNRVWGQGSFESGIAVCGEAPGADEDRTGTPFIGRAGQTLRAGLAATGTNPDTVWYLNLIACRPPDNDLGGFEGAEARKACRPGFDAELKFLESNGIRVIIAAGAYPAARFGVESSISKARGSVYEYST